MSEFVLKMLILSKKKERFFFEKSTGSFKVLKMTGINGVGFNFHPEESELVVI
jgi:hypothetical protein